MFGKQLTSAWLRQDDVLPSSESEKSLLHRQGYQTSDDYTHDKARPKERMFSVGTTLASVSILLNFGFLGWIWFNIDHIALRYSNLDTLCSRHSSVYRSPLDDHIPVSYHTVQFNSSLTHSSIYASPASPEVDDAWYDLGIRANHFALPETVDPTQYGIFPWQAKRDPDLGGGYVVFTEALHQLHCLNMLRKVSYWDYDYYHEKGKDTPQDLFNHTDTRLRTHSYHCLDMLRERIQCSADRAVFGMVWIEGDGPFDPGAFPQYSTERKCQDFDALSHFVQSNTIHDDWHFAKFQDGDKVFKQDSDLF